MTTFGSFVSDLDPVLKLELENEATEYYTYGSATQLREQTLDGSGYEESGPSLLRQASRLQFL